MSPPALFVVLVLSALLGLAAGYLYGMARRPIGARSSRALPSAGWAFASHASSRSTAFRGAPDFTALDRMRPIIDDADYFALTTPWYSGMLGGPPHLGALPPTQLVNPANGLTMVGAVDVAGNPFGFTSMDAGCAFGMSCGTTSSTSFGIDSSVISSGGGAFE